MRRSMALVICSVVLASCTSATTAGRSSPMPTSSPSGQSGQLTMDQRWPVGPVADIAVGRDAVYVLYSPPTSEGALSNATETRLGRIDRASGKLITAGPFPFARQIALAGGVVWIGPNNQYAGTSAPDSRMLLGVDARSLSTQYRVTLPNDGAQQALVANLASDSDTVWVAYGRHLYRLAAGSGAMLASHSLLGIATSVAIDPAGRRLYVGLDSVSPVSNATITAFDATALTPLFSATTGGGDLGGPHLAAGAQDVWVSYATGMLGQVEHRQASNLAQLPVASAMHTNGVQVFEIAGMVWVSDDMAGQLMCLDPQTGAVRATWGTLQGGVVDGDGSTLYFGDINGLGSFQPDPRCL